MDKRFTVTVLPEGNVFAVCEHTRLLDFLRQAGLAPDAPCGGHGTCGKCKVPVDGQQTLACQTVVDRDLTVGPIRRTDALVLSQGIQTQIVPDPEISGNLLAIDLGTTTMVCYLLDRQGRELAAASGLNPQSVFGGDVISRIRLALDGKQKELVSCVREGLSRLIGEACEKVGVLPAGMERIALVGNPCMQQLLLDIPPENLARFPFAPVLREMKTLPAGSIFPICPDGEFLIVPDISGYVGADTLACVLATEMYKKDTLTLLVDIGTNGEMVLGNRHRMIACSAAAGPALEGANIRFGMRGSDGAIDRVAWESGQPKVHVLGDVPAVGICGSGLIDAVAGMLENGLINRRGRIQSEKTEFEGQRAVCLTQGVCLTQKDIRQVQLAKGAIAAGICLMIQKLGTELADVDEVLLAGAFGSSINPASACAIGLLPPGLLPKIRAVGNAAGSGAKLLAASRDQQALAEELAQKIEFLELASLPEFQNTFGKATVFGWEGL